MSWSSCFTGKQSFLPDCSHRIYIDISYELLLKQEEVDAFCKNLNKAKFFHFCTSIPKSNGPKNELERRMNAIENIIAALESQSTEIEMNGEVFVTLKIYSPEELDEKNANRILSGKVKNLSFILMKSSESGRDVFVQQIIRVKSLFSSNQSIAFGIGGIDDIDDLEWILNHTPKNLLSFVLLNGVSVPNIRIREIELSHSWGCNVMLSLAKSAADIEAIKKAKYLQEMEVSYGVTGDVVLAKCLLQLGCIVGLPSTVFSETDLITSFARLVHPFVYRKPFVSSHKMVSLLIKDSDVQRIVDLSEEDESQKYDWKWKPHVTALNEAKLLNY